MLKLQPSLVAPTHDGRAALESHERHRAASRWQHYCEVMQEMFEASVDGEAFDMDRWGQYFRPAGMAQRTGDPQKAASPQATATSQSAPVAEAAPVAAPVATPEPTPAAPAAAPAATGGDASDILAMIRSRQG